MHDNKKKPKKKRSYGALVLVTCIGITIVLFAWGNLYRSSDDFIKKCDKDVSDINNIIGNDTKISTDSQYIKKAIGDGCINIVEGNGFNGFIHNKLELK